MTKRSIPYGKQHITEEDIASVVKVLKSDFLTQGPMIEKFESHFANYVGSRFAVAVSNGTAALQLSALSMNVKPGDKVITTPITFAATANCIKYLGGEVVFCDIDKNTLLLDLIKVEEMLQSSPAGTYKGIIPVDFAGRAVNLERLKKIADKYGCWIIEDACHAPGGDFIDSSNINQRCGNGNFANLAIFSFHPVKHIACGEGGMITTNDEALFIKLKQLRTHGIIRDKEKFKNSLEFAVGEKIENKKELDFPSWYMEMQELGYNFRLTDFQAALGISQLKRAKNNLIKRQEIAFKYDEAFEKINSLINKNEDKIVYLSSNKKDKHAFHLYVIKVNKRLDLYNYLKSKGIHPQIHYIPLHLMPYYRELGWKEGDLIIAENYYKTCLSLPMFPSLSEEDQNYVIECIESFYIN